MCHAGNTHRDIRVSNLLISRNAGPNMPFELSVEEFLEEYEDLSGLNLSGASLELMSDCVAIIREDARLSVGILNALGVLDDATAVTMDFALCAELNGTFFETHDSGTISVRRVPINICAMVLIIASVQGTVMFMSDAALEHLRCAAPYLQPPVDDMHSFLWTCIYAAIHTRAAAYHSDHVLQEVFANRRPNVVDQLSAEIRPANLEKWSPMLRALGPSRFFKDWRNELSSLVDFWETWFNVLEAEDTVSLTPSTWELVFRAAAVRGVRGSLCTARDHWTKFQSSSGN